MPQFDALLRYGQPNVAWDKDPARQMKGVETGSSDANIVDTPLAPEEGGIEVPPQSVLASDPWEKYAPEPVAPADPWEKYAPKDAVDLGDISGRDLRGMRDPELQQEPWYTRTYNSIKNAYAGMESFDDKKVAEFKEIFGTSDSAYMLMGTARALDIGVRTAELAYRGAQDWAFKEAKRFVPENLARDIVSLPDAFAGSPGHFQRGKVHVAGGVGDIPDVVRHHDFI